MRKEWQTQWLKKGKWNEAAVLSALRGPDHDCYKCCQWKEEIVARLRSIVFTEEEFPGNWCDVQLSQDMIESLPRLTAPDHAHFIRHLVYAIVRTEQHPVWGGLAERLILATRNLN